MRQAIDLASDTSESDESPRHALSYPFVRSDSTLSAGRIGRIAFWGVPAIGLFLVTLHWTGIAGNAMNLGGDDSHLMYAYPWQWLAHASLPAVDQNLGGYNPRTYFVPLMLVIGAIRSAGINPQGVIFGAVLALTFSGIARLTLEFLGERRPLTYSAALLAGSLSVSAPLLAETQWSNLLTSIIWQPLLPWFLLLYIWHQKRGSWVIVAAAAAVVAVASSAVNQFSWTIACGILLMGLALVAGLTGVYHFRPMRLLGFSALIFAVNAFWLIPIVAAPLLEQAQVTTALASSGKATAIDIVRAVAPTAALSDAVMLRNSASMMQSFGWPALVPDQWSQSLELIGLLPAGVVVGGLVRAWLRPLTTTSYWLFIGLGSLTVLFLYLETLQLLPSGVAIFEFLTRTIPGWTAERNFYDKFAIPYIEAVALLVGLGFYHLFRNIPGTAAGAIGLVASTCLVVYDLPFFAGAEFKLPYYLNVSYDRVMPGLPKSYLGLLDKLRNLPPGAVLSLPLSAPAWTVVRSDQGEGVYIGISPIFFLTGRDDYNGVGSFDNLSAPFLSAIVKDDLERGDVGAVARLAGELGVRYVVVNRDDDINHDYYRVAAVEDMRLEYLETSTLVSNFAPRLLARYGSFELRELAPSVSQPVVALQSAVPSEANAAYLEGVNLGVVPVSRNGTCTMAGDLRGRGTQDEYWLTLPPTSGACNLVVRRAFSSSWRAEVVPRSAGSGPVVSNKIYGFANSFPITPSPRARQLHLTYGEKNIILAGALLSLISGGCLAVLLLDKARRWLLAR